MIKNNLYLYYMADILKKTQLKQYLYKILHLDIFKYSADMKDFDMIIDKYISSEEQADYLLQEIQNISAVNTLSQADEALLNKLQSIIQQYGDTEGLGDAIRGLVKELNELQIRIILMRCSKSIDFATGTAKQLFIDLAELLTDKLKNVNAIYDEKAGNIYNERMTGNILMGGSNNIFWKKYNKYKSKYLGMKSINM